MREIKYKARIKDTGEIVKVSAIIFDEVVFCEVGDGIVDEHNDVYAFDEVDLMQWTGLYDKDGKEVYEGDILHHKGVNYAVEWKNYKWRLCKKNGDGHPFMQVFKHPENFEIISNIYEV